jgi:hypothetical protein
MDQQAVERESLKEEMSNVLGESRMVIPGAQALFGFQTMAVFNQRFEDLPKSGVICYLAGLGLLALSIALLLAPAAYHRIAQRGEVSHHMLKLSSRFLSLGMAPLMLSLALDIYVVCLAALDDARIATVAAVIALAVYCWFWFLFPLTRRRR